MCELMAVWYPDRRPFGEVLPWALELERLGVAGFGWGVAWLEKDRVRGYRQVGRLADDERGRAELESVASGRFLIHLRRPSKLSTVQLPDTQPFVAEEGRFAFCHNGRLNRHHAYRPRFAGRLRGLADSEVGFRLVQHQLDEGVTAGDALARTHRAMGGRANFGYLGQDGTLLAYAGNALNAVWRFRLGDAWVASSALHSDDRSLLDLLFTQAKDARKVQGMVPVGPSSGEPLGLLVEARRPTA